MMYAYEILERLRVAAFNAHYAGLDDKPNAPIEHKTLISLREYALFRRIDPEVTYKHIGDGKLRAEMEFIPHTKK